MRPPAGAGVPVVAEDRPVAVPGLAALERAVAELPADALPGLLGEVERLKALLWVRMMTPQATPSEAPGPANPDHYLTMRQVKERTGLSLSYVYELGRRGILRVRPMGRGRGYRVLLSDLLSWEASLPKDAVDARVGKMLSSSHDRRGAPAGAGPPWRDADAAGAAPRRTPDHAQQMGARSVPHPGGRRPTAPAPGEAPA